MNQDRFQTVGTIVALVISLIALVTTIYEANLMKAQQKAMVWPYVTVGANYSNEGFAFKAQNDGIGPAIVKSMEVQLDGKYFKDFESMLKFVKPDHTFGYDRVFSAGLTGTVIKAGEERVLLGLPWEEESRAIAPTLNRVVFRVQYESVLGDYWVYDSAQNTTKEERLTPELAFNNR